MKKLENHTPSPWRVVPQDKIKKGHGQRFDIFGNGFVAGDACERDAVLIAISPDMLSLLRDFKDRADDIGDHMDDYEFRLHVVDGIEKLMEKCGGVV